MRPGRTDWKRPDASVRSARPGAAATTIAQETATFVEAATGSLPGTAAIELAKYQVAQ